MTDLLRKIFKRRNSVDILKNGKSNDENGSDVRDEFERKGLLYSSKGDAFKARPDWKVLASPSLPPHQMTVTHIEHTKRYLAAGQFESTSADLLSTAEWLKTNSTEALKLTLADLMEKAVVSGPKRDSETGEMKEHLQFKAADITDFEYTLSGAIENYAKRVKWLLSGSRRVSVLPVTITVITFHLF